MNDDKYSYDKISSILKRYSPKKNQDELTYFNNKFIWGIKSPYDISESEPSALTMNDLTLWYDEKRGIYYLDVDTLTVFDTADLKILFLERLRDSFKHYLMQQKISTTDDLDWEACGGMLLLQSDRIEQVYTQFNIFVEGFKKCHS